jgi:beta-lactam-binding protein with PASTA domain
MAETDGLNQAVSDQAPAAGAKMPAGSKVMLYTFDQEPPQPMDMVSVPGVKGLSMVEAGRQLRARGFEMEISGTGLAVRQEPAAGTFAPPESRVKVYFERP